MATTPPFAEWAGLSGQSMFPGGFYDATPPQPNLFTRYFPTLNSMRPVATAAGAAAEPAAGLARLAPALSRLKSFGPKALKGAAIGQGAGMLAEQIGERAFGDNFNVNRDPTNFGQSWTRGLAGGARIGGFAGPVGAVTGMIGSAVGNVGGSALSDAIYEDGESGAHLGNLPFIGGAFGGGTGTQARDIEDKYNLKLEDLTFDALVKKVDSYKLKPEVRQQVVDSFNQSQADLRAKGMSNEEATAQLYNRYFKGEGDTPPLVTQYRDGKLTFKSPNAPAAAPAQSDALARIMAFQQVLAQVAPQLFTPQPQSMELYNSLMDRTVPNLAPELQPWATKSQADTNAAAQAQNAAQASWFQSYPAILAQQALQTEQAKAAAAEAQLQMALAQGAGANQDILTE